MELSELGLSTEQMEVVSKLIQGEGDRVRTKYSSELKELNSELEKFKPIEKSETEKALEQRQKELELKEQEIANKEKAMTIANKLKEKGLPSELAKFLNLGDDIEQSIDEVGATVNSYFLNSSNKPSFHAQNKGLTKSDFKKMSYGERAKLFNESPDLYKTLSN